MKSHKLVKLTVAHFNDHNPCNEGLAAFAELAGPKGYVELSTDPESNHNIELAAALVEIQSGHWDFGYACWLVGNLIPGANKPPYMADGSGYDGLFLPASDVYQVSQMLSWVADHLDAPK